MLCHVCNTNEATVHETRILDGQIVERHVCPQCAAREGIDAVSEAAASSVLQTALSQLAETEPSEIEPSEAAAPPPKPKPGSTPCEGCGLRFEDFKQSSLLGCPRCYQAFERQLGALLERAHEGATHHVGKIPRRALAASKAAGTPIEAMLGGVEERAERLAALRKQLERAVAAEQFERAARIRDEIGRLGGNEPAEAGP